MSKTIKTRHVLRTYWGFIKIHKGAFFVTVFGVILANVFNLITPFWYKRLFDFISVQTDLSNQELLMRTVLGIIIIIFLLACVRWVFYRGAAFTTLYFQARVMMEMRDACYSYILGHSYKFFSDNFAGAISQKINRFIRAFEKLHDELLWSVVPLFVAIIFSLSAMYWRSPWLAMVILVWIIIIFILNFSFSRWKLKYDLVRASADTEVSGGLVDGLTNNVNIKLFTGTAYEKTRLLGLGEKLRKSSVKAWSLSDYSFSVQSMLGILIEVVILYIVVKLWMQGSFTIGDFVFVQAYVLVLLERIWNLGRVMRNVYEAFSDAQEMVDILEKPYDVQDLKTAKNLKIGQVRIKFDKVTFYYNQTRLTLDRFDLEIKPKEKIALVGSSGAGKSTIVKLLMRFYDVSSGHVLIDGQDIARVKQDSLRSQIAFVPQDPILFHRTLMENLRYGRREASNEEVIEAAKKAKCHDFIQDLADGYDTYVGERGIKLSGGERQRVAIARTILKNAPILILDEATSSLDSESEYLIQEALRELMKGKTVMVIAHRLSTIMQMDRIVVVEDGRVVDQGTHQELMNRAGMYQKLWKIQAGGFSS